jgi:CheY-like chemotaxis protein
VAFNNDYVITNANSRSSAMVGLKSHTVLNRENINNLSKIIYPDDLDMIMAGLGQLKNTDDRFDFEHRVKHFITGKIVWLTGTAKILSSHDGSNIYQSVFINTTGHKNGAFQRFYGKDKGSASALPDLAFDLRTFVNSITGTAIIAEANADSPEKAREYIKRISESGKYLLKLIDGENAPDETENGISRIHAANVMPNAVLPDGVLKKADESDKSGGYSFKGKKILIAEDNHINRDIFSEILQMSGAETDTVADGLKAVLAFEKSDLFYYDLIFMDIRMPVMDGIESAKSIRGLLRPDAKSVPIIAMTAADFSGDVLEGMKSGMNGYVSKPLDMNILRTVLNSL